MFSGFSPEQQRWFAEGMYANAVHGGRSLAKVVDFSHFQRLLDVGGNSGGYAISLARANPGLRATIFDLEPVRELAMERVAAAGLADHIGFAVGSFFEDELPQGHDVVLLSSILHDWDDYDCTAILGRCIRAIEPGGTIVVAEPILAEDATGPDHPAASGPHDGPARVRTARGRVSRNAPGRRFARPWKSDLLPQKQRGDGSPAYLNGDKEGKGAIHVRVA